MLVSIRVISKYNLYTLVGVVFQLCSLYGVRNNALVVLNESIKNKVRRLG